MREEVVGDSVFAIREPTEDDASSKAPPPVGDESRTRLCGRRGLVNRPHNVLFANNCFGSFAVLRGGRRSVALEESSGDATAVKTFFLIFDPFGRPRFRFGSATPVSKTGKADSVDLAGASPLVNLALSESRDSCAFGLFFDPFGRPRFLSPSAAATAATERALTAIDVGFGAFLTALKVRPLGRPTFRLTG